MISFMPKEENYFRFFDLMAAEITKCTNSMKALFDDFDHHVEHADAIRGIEHSCDNITRDIILHLNKTFITPFDREDIHELASTLDDIVDKMDWGARRTVLYQVKESNAFARRMSDVLVRIAPILEKAVNALGKNDRTILELCNRIHVLESEGDSVHHDAERDLFSGNKDAVEIIKWKELYDALERSIDKCDDCANVIEAIILKQG